MKKNLTLALCLLSPFFAFPLFGVMFIPGMVLGIHYSHTFLSNCDTFCSMGPGAIFTYILSIVCAYALTVYILKIHYPEKFRSFAKYLVVYYLVFFVAVFFVVYAYASIVNPQNTPKLFKFPTSKIENTRIMNSQMLFQEQP